MNDFLKNLKSGDQAAVQVQGQETLWRRCTVKHGHLHGSIIVELLGREIEFNLDGVCIGDPAKGVMDKLLVPITEEMEASAHRVLLLATLQGFDFNLFTNKELSAIVRTLEATVRSRCAETKS